MPSPLEFINYSSLFSPEERFAGCFDKVTRQIGPIYDRENESVSLENIAALNKNYMSPYLYYIGDDLMNYCLKELEQRGFAPENSAFKEWKASTDISFLFKNYVPMDFEKCFNLLQQKNINVCDKNNQPISLSYVEAQRLDLERSGLCERNLDEDGVLRYCLKQVEVNDFHPCSHLLQETTDTLLSNDWI